MNEELISNCNTKQLEAFKQIEEQLFSRIDNLSGARTNLLLKKYTRTEQQYNLVCKIKDFLMRYPEEIIRNQTDKIEDSLFFIMNEEGLIDGRKLHVRLKQNKNTSFITPLLDMPRDYFNLAEFIKEYPGDITSIKGLLNGIV